MDYLNNLDAPLLRLSAGDHFTLGDACRGVQIFGGTGSGKSSGSGAALATAYLKAGFGGLVLCAKPDEAARWQRYAAAAGREKSVLVVSPTGGWRFNFLDYILTKEGLEATNTAVDVLMRIAEAARMSKDRPGDKGAQFFEDATRQLLGNTIPVLFSAHGRMNLADLYRFIASAPKTTKQAEDVKWQRESFFFETMMQCFRTPAHRLSEHELGMIGAYWRHDFAELDPETKSNIVITVTSMLSRFLKGRLHDLFCTWTNFVPDLAFHGGIVVLDMPVKTYDADGIIAAQLVKYLFQKAVEARRPERPVFLWADESQFFISSYDAEFQSTARSAMACTVYITQSLPTYYAKMGGAHPEHYADMLLSNFMTKIFHSNGCNRTNKWASESIGQRIVARRTSSSSRTTGENLSWNEGEGTNEGYTGSGNSSYDHQSYRFTSTNSTSRGQNRNRGKSGGENVSDQTGESFAEQKDWRVPPESFAGDLATGGSRGGGMVDAVWHQPDRLFARSGSNWLFTRFRQG